MEILLGGISSLFFGIGDFLGGEGSKRAPAASVVLWAGVISTPFIVIVAVVVGGTAGLSDFAIGALAGVSGSIGLVLLFAGLARGQAAAVAPIAAAFGAVVPVVAAVIGGERPSTLAWAGVLVAIPAIMLSAWVVEPGDLPGGGFLYGVAAGLGFGGFTAIIASTSSDSNLLPLIASRGASITLILLVGIFGLWQVTGFGGVPRRIVVANGLLDVTANVSLLIALRAGSVALAAVAASFYPAVTVLMARLVNAEHLRARQVGGLALTLVALGAIALG